MFQSTTIWIVVCMRVLHAFILVPLDRTLCILKFQRVQLRRLQSKLYTVMFTKDGVVLGLHCDVWIIQVTKVEPVASQ